MSEWVFNNEVHSGPTKNDFSIRVDDSRGVAFEATQGMTREEAQRKNEQAVDDLFKQEEIGSVFETREKKLEEKTLSRERNDLKTTSNSNNGIDSNDIDALKRKLSDQEKGMKEPSVEPSLNFVK